VEDDTISSVLGFVSVSAVFSPLRWRIPEVELKFCLMFFSDKGGGGGSDGFFF